MEDCIFCMIVNGKLPGKIAYEDDQVLAFYDIQPQAPVHVLIVPKKHYDSILDVGEEENELLAHLFQVANKLARELGLGESGFRLVVNTGKDSGQMVPHLHVHLIGGRPFGAITG